MIRSVRMGIELKIKIGETKSTSSSIERSGPRGRCQRTESNGLNKGWLTKCRGLKLKLNPNGIKLGQDLPHCKSDPI